MTIACLAQPINRLPAYPNFTPGTNMTTPLRIKRKALALEMIDFQQGDNFGPELETIISDIVKAVKEGASASNIEKSAGIFKLQDAIFLRLKMRTKIHTKGMLAAILPFYSNKNHIFLDKMWRGNITIKDQEKILANSDGKKGYVDTKKATLGGVFSEYVNPLYINFNELVFGLDCSPAEITGILMHELGHGFYACEYSDRVDSSNQVLADIAKQMKQIKEKRDVEYMFRLMKKLDKDTKLETAEALSNGDRLVMGKALHTFTIGAVGQQLENAKYDQSSFENLADNFPVRFGYGRPLLSGLQKLHKKYPENVTTFVTTAALTLGTLTQFIVACLALAAGGLLIGMFHMLLSGVFMAVLTAISGEDGRSYVYDDAKLRYTRIKLQLVEQIKHEALDAEDVPRILEDIEMMDLLIKDTSQYRTYMDYFMNFVGPANRAAKKSIQNQQLLEQLASNDLFVQALKLKTAA